MMQCHEFEDILITQIYGKPVPSQIDNLMSHIRDCPTCAKQYEQVIQTRNLFEIREDVFIPNWEKSWKVVLEGVTKKRRVHFKYMTYPRLMYAGAAVIIVFIIGLFAGRQLFLPKAEDVMAAADWVDSRDLALDTYAERLEVILIDFTNRGDRTGGKEATEFEKKVIMDMLLQTWLLKNFHSQEQDSPLMALLNEVECILTSILNLRSEDLESADQLDKIIRDQALNLKLQQLSRERMTI